MYIGHTWRACQELGERKGSGRGGGGGGAVLEYDDGFASRYSAAPSIIPGARPAYHATHATALTPSDYRPFVAWHCLAIGKLGSVV